MGLCCSEHLAPASGLAVEIHGFSFHPHPSAAGCINVADASPGWVCFLHCKMRVVIFPLAQLASEVRLWLGCYRRD